TVNSGATLQITGTITNFGTFTATAGTIEYIGTNPQTIANNTFVSNTIGTLSIANSNSSQLTLQGNLSVSNLTFNANAGTGKLNLNGNSLTISGSITNPGTSIIGSTSSSLLFTGTGSTSFGLDQTTPGSTNALQNLSINRSGGIVTLLGNTILSSTGSLTFTDGKLAIGANTLTIGGTITNTIQEGIRGSSSSSILVNGSTNNTLSFDQTTPGTTNALHTLTISTTNSNTTSVHGNMSIENTLQVDALQTLNLSSYALAGTLSTITNNGTITTQNTSALPILSGKTWGGLVHYNGTAAQKAVAGTYNNLTISNTAGATATGDITVNGTLDLPVDNPNATNGVLEMTYNYGDYSNILTATEDLTTTSAQSHDFLDSYILYMGNGAMHSGQGDVTGKVKRTTIVANVEYTFGSPYSSITFSSAGTAPSEVMFIITKGPDRGIHSNKTNTVQRLYQVIRTGGASPNKFTLKMRYLDSELNGNTKSELVTWDHHIPYGTTNTPHQHGRTALDQTENWVSIAGHGIGYLAQTQNVGDACKYWMIHPPSIPLSDFVWEAASEMYISKWDEAANWSSGSVPTATSNVLIPASKDHYPILEDNTSYEVKTITIENGASLTLGDNTTFTVQGGPADNGGIGSWSNQGNVTAGTSTVIFNFEEATIDGATAFHNLTINSSKVVTLQSGSVTQIGGTFTNYGTFNAGFFTNTVEYNGAGDQSVINPNGDIPKYYTLILSGSGTKTIAQPGDIEIINDFKVSNTAIANCLHNLTVGGSIIIDNGATLQTNSNSFFIKGDIVFNGLSDAGSTSRVEMIGSQNQTISGNSTPYFYTIEIDNANNVSLLTNVAVMNELILTNGNVQVQNTTLGINGTISGTTNIEVTPYSSLSFGGTVGQTIPDNVFSSNPIISNLTISNAAGVTPGNQPFTIEGTLALNEGEFTIDSKTLTIEGTLTRNTGTIGMNSSTQLYFSENTNALTIPNSAFADTEIGILSIDRSGGVILGNQTFTIADKLLLTNGILTTGSNIIRFPAGSQAGYDVDEFGNILEINHLFPEIVSSHIQGCATKVGAEPFVFPIGSAQKYAPIAISDAPGGDVVTEFTACYYPESPNSLYNVTSIDEILDHVSTSEYWTLSRAVGTNPVSVELFWWDNRSGGVTVLDELHVAHWNGTQWESKGNEGVSGNFEVGSITSELVSSFSPFTLGSTSSENPLPITLLSFTAACNTSKKVIEIDWSCATEINNDFFTVEKYSHESYWEPIAKIGGAGNSNTPTHYSITDNNKGMYADNMLYYRLKQTDKNGEFSYSTIVSTYGCGEFMNDCEIYPNPVISDAIIQFNFIPQSPITVEICDMQGKIIKTMQVPIQKNKQEISMNFAKIPAGSYILHVSDTENKTTTHFIKK
ncbi:MAG TPA: T9SS type A sorting domain-containing protein, partial [Bacteroidales bacterium]|nr:T9SS type A sorting domain-containing protein [Bacteroidales bacterium]